MRALHSAAGWALSAQVVWAILSAIWNFTGVALIAQGQRALGPTASIGGAIVLLTIAVALVATVSRLPVVYLLISIVGGVAAIAAVLNAFAADPALWPSEFWRSAGAVLNGIGFVAAVFGIATTAWQRCSRAGLEKLR